MWSNKYMKKVPSLEIYILKEYKFCNKIDNYFKIEIINAVMSSVMNIIIHNDRNINLCNLLSK